jgi:DNA-binding NarL/FixJ family response regulator
MDTDRDIFLFLRRCDGLVVMDAFQEQEQALTQAQEVRTHVILLDLNASNQVGLQTISRLRKSMPDAAIVLSSLETEGYRRAVLAAGADDLVLKTSFTTDLMPAIQHVKKESGTYQ